MVEPDPLDVFIRPLTASGIAHFVTGGVAAVIYGEPRFTRDIDVVVSVRPADADRFLSLWPEASFYAPPRETFLVESARTRHGHFNLVHNESGLVADCYVAGGDRLHRWAFEQLRTVDVDGLAVPVAPVEYVIARKLSYFVMSGSTRHLEDVARIIRVQGDMLDEQSLKPWLEALDVTDAWRQARQIKLHQP